MSNFRDTVSAWSFLLGTSPDLPPSPSSPWLHPLQATLKTVMTDGTHFTKSSHLLCLYEFSCLGQDGLKIPAHRNLAVSSTFVSWKKR